MTEVRDWAWEILPGDGWEIPTDDERDRADATLKRFDDQWGEQHTPIPRVHPEIQNEGTVVARPNPAYLVGQPTNRAYVRSRMRRWWAGVGRAKMSSS